MEAQKVYFHKINCFGKGLFGQTAVIYAAGEDPHFSESFIDAGIRAGHNDPVSFFAFYVRYLSEALPGKVVEPIFSLDELPGLSSYLAPNGKMVVPSRRAFDEGEQDLVKVILQMHNRGVKLNFALQCTTDNLQAIGRMKTD